MRKPYIGITGFMHQDEVHAALEAFPDCGRLLMVGVLVSKKTLYWEQNKYPRRYPVHHEAGRIFVADKRCLNLVHYCSDEPPTWADVQRLLVFAGPNCGGIQFNGAWPARQDIRNHEVSMAMPTVIPNRGIVLQAKASPRLSPALLAAHLNDYRGVVSHVLLDASGGYGKPLDPQLMRLAVKIVHRDAEWIRIGIAGGLCAETLDGLAPIVAEYHDLSIDAEGRLRDAADGGGNLDLDKVRAYLLAAGELFQ